MLLRFVGVAVLLAGIVYLYWAGEQAESARSEAQDEATGPEQPDVYGRKVEYHQLNPDGTLHYRLNAERIEQYSERAYAEMESPIMHMTSPTQPPWDIRSDLGALNTESNTAGVKEDVLHLNQNVYMVQKHPDKGVMTVRSDVFRLYPDRQYAETDENVTIDTQVGRTVAAGLVADLETGILKLSSDSAQRVHTIVLPEQFKKS